jgi:hypothetical protein
MQIVVQRESIGVIPKGGSTAEEKNGILLRPQASYDRLAETSCYSERPAQAIL